MEPFHGYRGREIVNGKEIITYFDGESGEVKDAMEKRTEPLKEKKRKGQAPDFGSPDFVRSWRTNGRQTVKKRLLEMNEIGFLHSLSYFTAWESCFVVNDKNSPMSEAEIADTFGLSRSNVHDMLAKLNQRGFVSLVRRGGGRPNFVMVNCNVAFFGKYMRDIQECKTFADVEYKPQVWIPLKESPKRE